jgi:hypothetical protein
MLPLMTRGAVEKIGRTRCEDDRRTSPTLAGLLAKAKRAGRKQGDSDHVREDVSILMPADSRTGSVFCYKKVLEILLSKSSQISGLLAGREKKRWNRVSLTQLRVIKIVLPAERDHAPLAREAVKREFLKGQPPDFADERALLLPIEKVAMIAKPFRQLGFVLEQAQLAQHRGGELPSFRGERRDLTRLPLAVNGTRGGGPGEQ